MDVLIVWELCHVRNDNKVFFLPHKRYILRVTSQTIKNSTYCHKELPNDES